MASFIQIQTTTGSRDQAERIATALVERRLAACVQIAGPIASIYRWQGSVERGEEWLCVAKTLATSYSDVETTIRELHSYDCPEVIALPIDGGSDAYMRWMGEQLD